MYINCVSVHANTFTPKVTTIKMARAGHIHENPFLSKEYIRIENSNIWLVSVPI